MPDSERIKPVSSISKSSERFRLAEECRVYLEESHQVFINWISILNRELDSYLSKCPDANWQEQVEFVTQVLQTLADRANLNGTNQLYPSSALLKAAALNFVGTKGVLRKNGAPYASHPMIVDWLIVRFGNLTGAELEKVRILALNHDLLEESMVRILSKSNSRVGQRIVQPGSFIQPVNYLPVGDNLRTFGGILNDFLPGSQIGDAALGLMAPVLDPHPSHSPQSYDRVRAVYWINFYCDKQPHLRVIKLADKIHDVLDFEYILQDTRLDDEQRATKIAQKLGKIMFSAWHLTHDIRGVLYDEVSEEMWRVFETIYWQVAAKYLTAGSQQIVMEQLQSLESCYFDASVRDQFNVELDEYARGVGLVF